MPSISALQHLVGPYTTEEFFASIHEKRWAHLSEKFTQCKQLFSGEAMEEYLFAARPWSNPEPWEGGIMAAKAFKTKSHPPPITSVEEALSLYADGHTLILSKVNKRWPALAAFCNQLQDDLLASIDANVYLTPAGAQGFPPHYDTHDTILLQVEGSKQWNLRPDDRLQLPPVDGNQRAEFHVVDMEADIVGSESIKLEAGQALYMPRGVIHYGLAQEEHSMHITFGLQPLTWERLFKSIITEAMVKDVELRKTVPPAVLCDLNGNADLVRAMLQRAIDGASTENVWRFMYKRLGALGPGRGIESINRLAELTDDTPLALRDGASIFWDNKGQQPWFTLTGRRIKVPANMLLYISFIEDHPTFTAAQLPPDLPGNSRLNFARWMISQGLVHIND
jgi:hypothetical protein